MTLLESMKQSIPWEAYSRLASQEITLLLYDLTVRYSVQKSPPLVPVLSQMSQIHILPPSSLTIHLNTTLPSTPWFPKLSLSFTLSNQGLVCSFHAPRFDVYGNIGEKNKKLLITLFSPAHCSVIHLMSKYSPKHPAFQTPSTRDLPLVCEIKLILRQNYR
jgi:hypothetical protein